MSQICGMCEETSFRVLGAHSWTARLADDGLEDGALFVQVLTTCARTNDAMRYHRIIVTPHFDRVAHVRHPITATSLTVPDTAAARRALDRWAEMRRRSLSYPLRDWAAVLWELEAIVSDESR